MAQAIPDVAEEKTQKQEMREARQARDTRQPIVGKPAGPTVRKDDNIVFVGKKPTMSYVLAVMTQLQSGVSDVHIKARGRSISRAVDVAEVVRNRFMQDLKREIRIGTEQIEDMDKKRLNVSTIDIRMIR